MVKWAEEERRNEQGAIHHGIGANNKFAHASLAYNALN